jgi:hypothetical protein
MVPQTGATTARSGASNAAATQGVKNANVQAPKPAATDAPLTGLTDKKIKELEDLFPLPEEAPTGTQAARSSAADAAALAQNRNASSRVVAQAAPQPVAPTGTQAARSSAADAATLAQNRNAGSKVVEQATPQPVAQPAGRTSSRSKPADLSPNVSSPKASGSITSQALEDARKAAEGLRFRGNITDDAYTPYLKEWDEMMDIGVPNEYRTYGVTDRTAAKRTEIAKKIEAVAIESQKARGLRSGEKLVGANDYFGDSIGDTTRRGNRSFGILEQKINRAGDTRKMLQIYGEDPSGRGSTILYSVPLEEAEKLGLTDKLVKKGYSRFARGGIVYASKGSLIPYQPRGTDTVPAMLTPGEFVINKAATQRNLPLLKAINNNQVQGYSKGGQVNYLQNGGTASGGQSGGSSSFVLDSSAFTAAVADFNRSVSSLSSLTQGLSQLANLSTALGGINTAAATLSTASSLLNGAAGNLTSPISAFTAALNSVSSVLTKVPSEIKLVASGSIPVLVTVEVNGGEGLEQNLQPFADEIYNKVADGIRRATNGNLNIEVLSTRGQ